ncbi:MAG TPA: helix-turn-helix domain-containing protein [Candidatus Intestinimonas pullistercoris]|uniref:Helix-turn-helix domain-containing protein n=1 Tax=Candidatus Intestinimonas pullistercoris TaxID=2838623 RepID=A0A9D2SZJ4_9FIRM|nr:helix-turn-helix transcriptional regulator [uncultured Intestinimonas sp.]HJC40902.1 helix-turn-helix domain-containing protein [Candidatus Intestinimonas pullistercoris]
MYSNEIFGERLRRLRKLSGETQQELAEFLGLKPNQIGEMENGRKASTFLKLALLCEHYNITADYLLGLIDEPRPLRNAGPDAGDSCHSSERT